MMRRAAGLAVALLASSIAHAEVRGSSAAGFEVVRAVTVPADPARAYAAIGQVARWWSRDHTYSGDAANLSLDLRPGGCFCERLPGGGVEHMRVVHARPGQALILRGALGPLGGEGVDGALTFTLTPEPGGARIELRYAAGGYFPHGVVPIAAAVDQVLGEQLANLGRLLGGEQ